VLEQDVRALHYQSPGEILTKPQEDKGGRRVTQSGQRDLDRKSAELVPK